MHAVQDVGYQINQLLGLLHGFYGVGAVISPLIASLLVADAGLPW
jgi:fucose permease